MVTGISDSSIGAGGLPNLNDGLQTPEVAGAPVAAPKTEEPASQPKPPVLKPQELKKLVAEMSAAGVHLRDLLDAEGNLPPDKMGEARKRLSEKLKEAPKDKPLAKARLYESAAKLEPDNKELRKEVAGFYRDWAQKEKSDPKLQKTLLGKAKSHFESSLPSSVKDRKVATLAAELWALKGSLDVDFNASAAFLESRLSFLAGEAAQQLKSQGDLNGLLHLQAKVHAVRPQPEAFSRLCLDIANQSADPELRQFAFDQAKEALEKSGLLKNFNPDAIELYNSIPGVQKWPDKNYKIQFDAKSNPQAHALLEALKNQGVELQDLWRPDTAKPQDQIDASDVFAYVGERFKSDLVQGALKGAGIQVPPGLEKKIQKDGFGKAMAEHHATEAKQALQNKDKTKAWKNLNLALGFEPTELKHYDALANFYEKEKEPKAALQVLMGAMELAPKDQALSKRVGDLLTKTLQETVDQEASLRGRAQQPGVQQELKGLLQIHQQLAQSHPELTNSDANLKAVAKTSLILAEGCMKKGDAKAAGEFHEKALVAYGAIVAKDPKGPAAAEAHLELAGVYDAMGDPAKAMAELKQAKSLTLVDTAEFNPTQALLDYQDKLTKRLGEAQANRAKIEKDPPVDSDKLRAALTTEKKLHEALGESDAAKEITERLAKDNETSRIGALHDQVDALAEKSLLTQDSLGKTKPDKTYASMKLGAVESYLRLETKDGKTQVRFTEAFQNLDPAKKQAVLQHLARAGLRQDFENKAKAAASPAEKSFFEGQVARLEGNLKLAKDKFVQAQGLAGEEPQLKSLKAEAREMASVIEAKAQERRAEVLKELGQLLGPILGPAFSGPNGIDLTQFEGLSFFEFKRIFSAAISNDGIAFNAVLLASYEKVFEKPENQAFLRLIYEEVDPSAEKKAFDFHSEDPTDALKKLTSDLVSVSAGRFVGHHFSSKEGRERLAKILGDPENYSKSARANILREIASHARNEKLSTINSTHLEGFIGAWNYANLNISDQDLQKATEYAKDIFKEADDYENRAEQAKEKYLKHPEQVSLLSGEIPGPDGKPRALTADDVRRVASLVELSKTQVGYPSQAIRHLAQFWLLAADNSNWVNDNAMGNQENRAFILRGAETLMQQAQGIKSEAELLAFQKNLNAFMKGHLYPSGNSSWNEVKHFVSDHGFEEMFKEVTGSLKEPYEKLAKFNQENEALIDFKVPLEFKNLSLATEDPKLRGAVVNFIERLQDMQRSYVGGYKQFGYLQRGLSNVGNLVGAGGLADIERANEEIGKMIARLQQAKTPQDLKQELAHLQDQMKPLGSLDKAFRAADQDGAAQLMNLAQSTLEFFVISAVTEGAGSATVLARAAASMARGTRGARAMGGVMDAAATFRSARTLKNAQKVWAATQEYRAVARTADAALEAALGETKAMGELRSLGEVGEFALGQANRRILQGAEGMAKGAASTTVSTAFSVASKGTQERHVTIESLLKQAAATGFAMGMTGALASAEAKSFQESVLKSAWQRYTGQGIKGALEFAKDSMGEIFEEVVDAYVAKRLDGDINALTWDELDDIVRVCVAGGGAHHAIEMHWILNGFHANTAEAKSVAIQLQEKFEQGYKVLPGKSPASQNLVGPDGKVERAATPQELALYLRHKKSDSAKAKQDPKAGQLLEPESVADLDKIVTADSGTMRMTSEAKRADSAAARSDSPRMESRPKDGRIEVAKKPSDLGRPVETGSEITGNTELTPHEGQGPNATQETRTESPTIQQDVDAESHGSDLAKAPEDSPISARTPDPKSATAGQEGKSDPTQLPPSQPTAEPSVEPSANHDVQDLATANEAVEEARPSQTAETDSQNAAPQVESQELASANDASSVEGQGGVEEKAPTATATDNKVIRVNFGRSGSTAMNLTAAAAGAAILLGSTSAKAASSAFAPVVVSGDLDHPLNQGLMAAPQGVAQSQSSNATMKSEAGATSETEAQALQEAYPNIQVLEANQSGHPAAAGATNAIALLLGALGIYQRGRRALSRLADQAKEKLRKAEKVLGKGDAEGETQGQGQGNNRQNQQEPVEENPATKIASSMLASLNKLSNSIAQAMDGLETQWARVKGALNLPKEIYAKKKLQEFLDKLKLDFPPETIQKAAQRLAQDPKFGPKILDLRLRGTFLAIGPIFQQLGFTSIRGEWRRIVVQGILAGDINPDNLAKTLTTLASATRFAQGMENPELLPKKLFLQWLATPESLPDLTATVEGLDSVWDSLNPEYRQMAIDDLLAGRMNPEQAQRLKASEDPEKVFGVLRSGMASGLSGNIPANDNAENLATHSAEAQTKDLEAQALAARSEEPSRESWLPDSAVTLEDSGFLDEADVQPDEGAKPPPLPGQSKGAKSTADEASPISDSDLLPDIDQMTPDQLRDLAAAKEAKADTILDDNARIISLQLEAQELRDKADALEAGQEIPLSDGDFEVIPTPSKDQKTSGVEPQSPAQAQPNADTSIHSFAQENLPGIPRRGEVHRDKPTTDYGTAAGATHEGIGYKDKNEDAMVQGPNWALVLDGMGGAAAGDKASQVAADAISRYLQDHLPSDNPTETLRQALIVAGQAVNASPYGQQGGGAVGVMHLIVKNPNGSFTAIIAHVGDAGAVVVGRDGTIKYRSKDQSQVQMRADEAGIVRNPADETAELQMRIDPDANIVLGTLGAGYEAYPVVEEIPLEPGDRIAMFSDGVSDGMSTKEIARKMTAGQSAAAIQDDIFNSTLERMATYSRIFGDESVPGQRLQIQRPNGDTAFIDESGDVYDSPAGGKVVDHYKADNLTIHAYVHNPEGVSLDAPQPANTAQAQSLPRFSNAAGPYPSPRRPDGKFSDVFGNVWATLDRALAWNILAKEIGGTDFPANLALYEDAYRRANNGKALSAEDRAGFEKKFANCLLDKKGKVVRKLRPEEIRIGDGQASKSPLPPPRRPDGKYQDRHGGLWASPQRALAWNQLTESLGGKDIPITWEHYQAAYAQANGGKEAPASDRKGFEKTYAGKVLTLEGKAEAAPIEISDGDILREGPLPRFPTSEEEAARGAQGPLPRFLTSEEESEQRIAKTRSDWHAALATLLPFEDAGAILDKVDQLVAGLLKKIERQGVTPETMRQAIANTEKVLEAFPSLKGEGGRACRAKIRELVDQALGNPLQQKGPLEAQVIAAPAPAADFQPIESPSANPFDLFVFHSNQAARAMGAAALGMIQALPEPIQNAVAPMLKGAGLMGAALGTLALGMSEAWAATATSATQNPGLGGLGVMAAGILLGTVGAGLELRLKLVKGADGKLTAIREWVETGVPSSSGDRNSAPPSSRPAPMSEHIRHTELEHAARSLLGRDVSEGDPALKALMEELEVIAEAVEIPPEQLHRIATEVQKLFPAPEDYNWRWSLLNRALDRGITDETAFQQFFLAPVAMEVTGILQGFQVPPKGPAYAAIRARMLRLALELDLNEMDVAHPEKWITALESKNHPLSPSIRGLRDKLSGPSGQSQSEGQILNAVLGKILQLTILTQENPGPFLKNLGGKIDVLLNTLKGKVDAASNSIHNYFRNPANIALASANLIPVLLDSKLRGVPPAVAKPGSLQDVQSRIQGLVERMNAIVEATEVREAMLGNIPALQKFDSPQAQKLGAELASAWKTLSVYRIVFQAMQSSPTGISVADFHPEHLSRELDEAEAAMKKMERWKGLHESNASAHLAIQDFAKPFMKDILQRRNASGQDLDLLVFPQVSILKASENIDIDSPIHNFRPEFFFEDVELDGNQVVERALPLRVQVEVAPGQVQTLRQQVLTLLSGTRGKKSPFDPRGQMSWKASAIEGHPGLLNVVSMTGTDPDSRASFTLEITEYAEKAPELEMESAEDLPLAARGEMASDTVNPFPAATGTEAQAPTATAPGQLAATPQAEAPANLLTKIARWFSDKPFEMLGGGILMNVAISSGVEATRDHGWWMGAAFMLGAGTMVTVDRRARRAIGAMVKCALDFIVPRFQKPGTGTALLPDNKADILAAIEHPDAKWPNDEGLRTQILAELMTKEEMQGALQELSEKPSPRKPGLSLLDELWPLFQSRKDVKQDPRFFQGKSVQTEMLANLALIEEGIGVISSEDFPVLSQHRQLLRLVGLFLASGKHGTSDGTDGAMQPNPEGTIRFPGFNRHSAQLIRDFLEKSNQSLPAEKRWTKGQIALAGHLVEHHTQAYSKFRSLPTHQALGRRGMQTLVEDLFFKNQDLQKEGYSPEALLELFTGISAVAFQSNPREIEGTEGTNFLRTLENLRSRLPKISRELVLRKNPPMVSGHELEAIIRASKAKTSYDAMSAKDRGDILEAVKSHIQEQQIEGRVTTKDEALSLAQSLLIQHVADFSGVSEQDREAALQKIEKKRSQRGLESETERTYRTADGQEVRVRYFRFNPAVQFTGPVDLNALARAANSGLYPTLQKTLADPNPKNRISIEEVSKAIREQGFANLQELDDFLKSQAEPTASLRRIGRGSAPNAPIAEFTRTVEGRKVTITLNRGWQGVEHDGFGAMHYLVQRSDGLVQSYAQSHEPIEATLARFAQSVTIPIAAKSGLLIPADVPGKMFFFGESEGSPRKFALVLVKGETDSDSSTQYSVITTIELGGKVEDLAANLTGYLRVFLGRLQQESPGKTLEEARAHPKFLKLLQDTNAMLATYGQAPIDGQTLKPKERKAFNDQVISESLKIMLEKAGIKDKQDMQRLTQHIRQKAGDNTKNAQKHINSPEFKEFFNKVVEEAKIREAQRSGPKMLAAIAKNAVLARARAGEIPPGAITPVINYIERQIESGQFTEVNQIEAYVSQLTPENAPRHEVKTKKRGPARAAEANAPARFGPANDVSEDQALAARGDDMRDALVDPFKDMLNLEPADKAPVQPSPMAKSDPVSPLAQSVSPPASTSILGGHIPPSPAIPKEFADNGPETQTRRGLVMSVVGGQATELGDPFEMLKSQADPLRSTVYVSANGIGTASGSGDLFSLRIGPDGRYRITPSQAMIGKVQIFSPGSEQGKGIAVSGEALPETPGIIKVRISLEGQDSYEMDFTTPDRFPVDPNSRRRFSSRPPA